MTKNIAREKDFEDIVEEVKRDLKKRQEERKSYEAQWQLNMNFLMGNQNCEIISDYEIAEAEKEYYWQEKEVFNHISPIVEVRLAKLNKVRPTMTVVPASGDDKDLKTAKMSKKIINSVYDKLEVSNVISEATKWSEICGTSFYKVSWNSEKGKVLKSGENGVCFGDVEISVCSPFEIFPESSSSSNVEDCNSIIHAKAVHVDTIEHIWGEKVDGEDINIFSLDSMQSAGDYNFFRETKKLNGTRSNYALVIEKYEMPSKEFPNGRLIIIAGDKLLHIGELPYKNGKDGKRCFPFIRQTCIEHVGCFWGSSIIERLIPVQRAYNIVKNRKHEFMNRLSSGVLAVEDGSCDIDNLEDEGLSPGKILVYRQGSTPPAFLNFARAPIDFGLEEEKLLNEFILISGVSDLMRNSTINSSNISGTALQILIEQDDTRISLTAEVVRNSIRTIAQQILRLYKQFASVPRLTKIVGDNGDIEVFYFTSSDISSDDIVFETETEVGETIAQKRNMVFELLNAGLLSDENGKLSNRMRVKALDLLGFGVWENSQDINELQTKKASSENMKMLENKQVIIPLEIDDHDLHIAEHTAFMLGGEFEKLDNDSKLTTIMLEHIRAHKKMRKLQAEVEGVNNG